MDFFGIQRTTFDYKIDFQSFIQYNILNNIYAVHIKYGGSGNGNGAYLILKLYG